MIETMKLAMWPRRSLTACALLLAAGSLPAQEISLNFEPAQTKVEFTLGDVLHTVHGTFALKRGSIRFDSATGKADGELVVDATSGNSGSGTRDRRMNKEILESAKFPEIVFRPHRVEGVVAPQGPSRVLLHGVFIIHGSEHEIAVPVDVQAESGQYTATATFAVPYVKWGMKNPSTLFLRVNDHVEITIQAKMAAPPMDKPSQ
jgi:polyisoprenoid-binding protein YceI